MNIVKRILKAFQIYPTKKIKSLKIFYLQQKVVCSQVTKEDILLYNNDTLKFKNNK